MLTSCDSAIADDEAMREHYVTPQMNNPRFELPECIEPITL